MGNTNMHEAKTNINDEFYTRIEDINRELNNYRVHFKGKHIFMNCDDPKESDFWKYFYLNFEFLGIRKITSTHYHASEPTYRLDYDGKEITKTPLEQNGDFRSPEAIEILKEVDIVVTNPPFSIFREYVAQLIEYGKNFIIIGNMNAITYKEVFPLIRDGKVWLGQNNGVMEFVIPDEAPVKSGQRIDEEGVRYQKFGNIVWYTNMNMPRRNQDLILYENYSPENYPTYDNYDAINVDRVNQIPQDHKGVMGVPITFLTRHNPEQFEIIELSRYIKTKGMTKEFVKDYYSSGQKGQISEGHPDLCYYNNEKRPVVPYMRILIQRKSDD